MDIISNHYLHERIDELEKENERLRKALKEITELDDRFKDLYDAVQIARKALEESE